MNFLYVSFVQGHYQSEKKHCHTTQNTATPSGNNAVQFSTEVSKAHAAARFKGPEAADIDNKACIEALQNFFQTCMDSEDRFSKHAAEAKRACTLCFLSRGNTLAN